MANGLEGERVTRQQEFVSQDFDIQPDLQNTQDNQQVTQEQSENKRTTRQNRVQQMISGAKEKAADVVEDVAEKIEKAVEKGKNRLVRSMRSKTAKVLAAAIIATSGGAAYSARNTLTPHAEPDVSTFQENGETIVEYNPKHEESYTKLAEKVPTSSIDLKGGSVFKTDGSVKHDRFLEEATDVANKVMTPEQFERALNFYESKFGRPIANSTMMIRAISKEGVFADKSFDVETVFFKVEGDNPEDRAKAWFKNMSEFLKTAHEDEQFAGLYFSRILNPKPGVYLMDSIAIENYPNSQGEEGLNYIETLTEIRIIKPGTALIIRKTIGDQYEYASVIKYEPNEDFNKLVQGLAGRVGTPNIDDGMELWQPTAGVNQQPVIQVKD